MLGSITPLGERSRNSRWWVTVAWFFLGSLGGGAALGALLGLAGELVRLDTVSTVAREAAIAGLVIAGLALELRAPHRLAGVHRQVNDAWMSAYRGWVWGLGFGVQLGAGVFTIVTTAAVYTTLAAALLVASPVLGAAIGGMFGALRALPVLSVARVREPRQLGAVEEKLRRWDRPTATASRALQAGVVVAIAVALVVS